MRDLSSRAYRQLGALTQQKARLQRGMARDAARLQQLNSDIAAKTSEVSRLTSTPQQGDFTEAMTFKILPPRLKQYLLRRY